MRHASRYAAAALLAAALALIAVQAPAEKVQPASHRQNKMALGRRARGDPPGVPAAAASASAFPFQAQLQNRRRGRKRAL